MDLLRLGLFACGITNRHALEDGRVQHDAPNAVSAHDQAGCLLILLSIGHLDIDFEGADSPLPPFSIRELEQLCLASKVCLLFFLARFNYREKGLVSRRTCDIKAVGTYSAAQKISHQSCPAQIRQGRCLPLVELRSHLPPPPRQPQTACPY